MDFMLKLKYLFKAFPEAGAAFTGFTFVDEKNLRLYDNQELLNEPGLLKTGFRKLPVRN